MAEKAPLSLKTILVPSKTVTADFPGFDGFTVDLSYLSRDTMVKIRKKATKVIMKGRQTTEELNEELFLQLYADEAIKGWKGLKLSYVEQLAPVDLSDQPDLNVELPYSQENAYFLMRNSTTFDSWVSEFVTELGNFQASSAKK